MMNKFLLGCGFLWMLMFYGCNEPFKDVVNTRKVQQQVRYKIKNDAFLVLVKHFQLKSLPISSFITDEFSVFDIESLTLEDIYIQKRIPIDTVVKYFCRGVKERNNQPSGGIYEYYYGYRFVSNGDYIILFYFRPSDDTYCYRIATFDYDGVLIDDIGIGGQKNEEAYKWFEISNDLSIRTEEIYCDMSTYSEENGIEVIRIDKKYQITKFGKIKLIKETNLGQVTYIDNGTKLVEKINK